MLRTLRLEHYKCFDLYTVDFEDTNIIIGPNNAGKSTIISALRAGASMLAITGRRQSHETRIVNDQLLRVYPLARFPVALELENLRHEFHDELPTSFELRFTDNLVMTATWPAFARPEDGFFYITVDGDQPIDMRRAKELVGPHSMGVLPSLRPLDPHEPARSQTYLERNLSGRLASSHFRNQLRLLDGWDYREYLAYVKQWLPEVRLSAPVTDHSADTVDLFYTEAGHEREISWAGDGVQVFLQILLHLFRFRSAATVVLDEPEVYLHAELQSRVLHAVEALDVQSVIASHSSEVVGAAQEQSIIWVDKSGKRALRLVHDDEVADNLAALGSIFNLRLASLLRKKTALFVEGKDVQILEPIAVTLGLGSIAANVEVGVVPIEGADNWRRLTTFDWIASKFLRGAVRGLAIFDRDFHSDEALLALVSDLRLAEVEAHVWNRHEIENYLLVPSAIERLTGCPAEEVQDTLIALAGLMRDEAVSIAAGTLIKEGTARRLDVSDVVRRASALVDSFWPDEVERLRRLPGKDLMSSLNGWLQGHGYRVVTARVLARSLVPSEIDPELGSVLRKVVLG